MKDDYTIEELIKSFEKHHHKFINPKKEPFDDTDINFSLAKALNVICIEIKQIKDWIDAQNKTKQAP